MKKHLHLALLLLATLLISTPQTTWAQPTAHDSKSAVITHKEITALAENENIRVGFIANFQYPADSVGCCCYNAGVC